jgi:hypothetical protein
VSTFATANVECVCICVMLLFIFFLFGCLETSTFYFQMAIHSEEETEKNVLSLLFLPALFTPDALEMI